MTGMQEGNAKYVELILWSQIKQVQIFSVKIYEISLSKFYLKKTVDWTHIKNNQMVKNYFRSEED